MSVLNVRQTKFVEEYPKDFSATAAAKRAGYSAKTAHSSGPRLLTHAGISAAIAERMGKMAERAEVTAQWVVDRLRHIAEAEETPASVRVSALALLSKHTGGFNERTEVSEQRDITVTIRSFDELPAPIEGNLVEHNPCGASGAPDARLDDTQNANPLINKNE